MIEKGVPILSTLFLLIVGGCGLSLDRARRNFG